MAGSNNWLIRYCLGADSSADRINAAVYIVLPASGPCTSGSRSMHLVDMNASTSFLKLSAFRSSRSGSPRILRSFARGALCPKCGQSIQRRFAHIPAEDPNFFSIVDNPPNIVKSGRRHGPGLIILGTPHLLISKKHLANLPQHSFP